jgi:hypothetical protein
MPRLRGISPQILLFTTLLDRMDITGAVITADALHAQGDLATYLTGTALSPC